jgi:hypothetical protein
LEKGLNLVAKSIDHISNAVDDAFENAAGKFEKGNEELRKVLTPLQMATMKALKGTMKKRLICLMKLWSLWSKQCHKSICAGRKNFRLALNQNKDFNKKMI